MKCPKCRYISFDHNQVCPKCEKDITLEQGKLNLPLFLANPPFLIASLIGEMEEIQGEYNIGSHAEGRDGEDSGFSFDDTTVLEGTSFDETQDLSMSLEDEQALKDNLDELPLEEPAVAGETEESRESLTFADPEASLKEEAAGVSQHTEEMDEEITFDFEEPKVSERAAEINGTQQLGEEKELDLDLGELTIDEADETLEMGGAQSEDELKEKPSNNAAFTLESDKEIKKDGTGEIELSLDDLKIDDTGELLIGDDTVVIDSNEIDTELDITQGDEKGGRESKIKGENLARLLPDEAPTLESESIPVETANEEELNIDLDDLDLELDLEGPEGKKT